MRRHSSVDEQSGDGRNPFGLFSVGLYAQSTTEPACKAPDLGRLWRGGRCVNVYHLGIKEIGRGGAGTHQGGKTIVLVAAVSGPIVPIGRARVVREDPRRTCI